MELAAGTGRIAIPLALSGYDVIAIDRSETMLDLLRGKAAEAGATERIDVRVGDLTAPGIEGHYDRVLVPFRSLLHLATDEERLAAFRKTMPSISTDDILSARHEGHRR